MKQELEQVQVQVQRLARRFARPECRDGPTPRTVGRHLGRSSQRSSRSSSGDPAIRAARPSAPGAPSRRRQRASSRGARRERRHRPLSRTLRDAPRGRSSDSRSHQGLRLRCAGVWRPASRSHRGTEPRASTSSVACRGRANAPSSERLSRTRTSSSLGAAAREAFAHFLFVRKREGLGHAPSLFCGIHEIRERPPPRWRWASD